MERKKGLWLLRDMRGEWTAKRKRHGGYDEMDTGHKRQRKKKQAGVKTPKMCTSKGVCITVLLTSTQTMGQHPHLLFHKLCLFVPCQQTIMGAITKFVFHCNPCFSNLTPTEFRQSLLRACCLGVQRFRMPWAFEI